MSVQSFIRKDVSGMLHHIDDCLQQAQKNCSSSFLVIQDWLESCLKDHTIHPCSIQDLSQPIVLPSEMNHFTDHRLPIPSSEVLPSHTNGTIDSASFRGVSSTHYGTIKSTPIASRMYSKSFTTDTKPSPVGTIPRPPKSRLIDPMKKPPEDPISERRAAAAQKYRGRLIDALVKECQSRNLPSTGTKSDLIFRLVENDLSRPSTKAKSPGSPFSISSRLASSVAMSPRGNAAIPRTVPAVKPFTHTTERTVQLAAEMRPDPLGEKGQQKEGTEKAGFGERVERTFQNNVLLESPTNTSGMREMKRPPDSSLHLHTEATRSFRAKLPADTEVHAPAPPAVGSAGEQKKPVADTYITNEDDTELWFESPLLENYIRKQSIVDPDWIFAPIPPCNLSAIFPDGPHASSDVRGSSGNWDDDGNGHARRNSFSKVNVNNR